MVVLKGTAAAAFILSSESAAAAAAAAAECKYFGGQWRGRMAFMAGTGAGVAFLAASVVRLVGGGFSVPVCSIFGLFGCVRPAVWRRVCGFSPLPYPLRRFFVRLPCRYAPLFAVCAFRRPSFLSAFLCRFVRRCGVCVVVVGIGFFCMADNFFCS